MPPLWLAGIVALASPLPGPPSLELDGQPLYVSADHVHLNVPAQRVYLHGAACITLGDYSLRADDMVADLLDPKQAVARARVHVSGTGPGGSSVTAGSAEYNLATHHGILTDCFIRVPYSPPRRLSDLMRPEERPTDLYLEAKRAEQTQRGLTLEHLALTNSPARPPQYRFLASRLKVEFSGERLGEDLTAVKAEDARLQLYGKTFLGLSELDFGAGLAFFPRIGSDGDRGLFIERPFVIGLVKPFKLRLNPRIGTQAFLSGSAGIEVRGALGSLTVTSSLKDRRPLATRGVTSAVWNRVPEVAWRAPRWHTPGLGGRLDATLSAGRYHEQGTGGQWREAGQIGWRGTLHRGRNSTVGAGAGARYAFYEDGSQFGWLRGELFVERAFGYRLYGGAGVISHRIFGKTPFHFDQIDFPTEVNTNVRWRFTPHWIASNNLWFDVNHSRLGLVEWGLSYRDRLIEYGLVVRSTPQFDLRLDAQFLGF
ncbi:MAG: hypothetical protein HYU66_01980 [Armatimonadetes bacterium]|nr:hypothetical protein [Armatimonadota bacterium]